MRWRLYIEEYSPDLKYIPGEKNVVADALSRLDKTDSSTDDSLETFYSIMEALPTESATPDFSHNPVCFDKLEMAQHQDSQIKQNLKMEFPLSKNHVICVAFALHQSTLICNCFFYHCLLLVKSLKKNYSERFLNAYSN